MLIGYARVSTEDQNLDLQRDAFTAGCERIFEEKASPAMIDRGSPRPCRSCGEAIAL
jgi:DNA invertase Pin-like site-specific DNA recombinase